MMTIDEALDALESHYNAAVERLRADIVTFARDGALPAASARAGRYTYPRLLLHYDGSEPESPQSRAFGRLNTAGTYATTVTRPRLFRAYLKTQLELIASDYSVRLDVQPSDQEIPFPYVLDGEATAQLSSITPQEIARYFPHTDLADIGDELADGIELDDPDQQIPLSLFDGLRTDFSLARLAHYTGTDPEHFQRFVLFTNYHRYVDEFVDWAGARLGDDECAALSGPGGLYLTEPTENAKAQLSDAAWRRHQMPAYHLIGKDGGGITLVNIGVGPSHA
ncbi:AMP nucleosidase, partial [Alteriqipengyuania sp.]|uniref:AMP nucleosidase n=1 Tax=Alteriqipengyuania sp. TaxID=2800692 RepID=UPI0035186EB6